MSFLPIVGRELRVASRRWSTFLIRTGVGLLAMVLCLPALFFGWLAGGGSGAGDGAFSVLSTYLFVLALLGGLLITADCLSSEKREGTLGLLFLTDLRGYDIVLGKFAGLGLHALYGMVAVFPALALPLLTGGVTGREFWRVSLALLNLLFVSLSVGMAISAVSRQASRAFSGTLVSLLLLVAGLPFLVDLLGQFALAPWVNWLAWVNPAHAFAVGGSTATPSAFNEYWLSLGVSHVVAWMILVGAGLVVPRSWQDKDRGPKTQAFISRFAGDRISRVFRIQRSPLWLERNPILWLMGERPVLKGILWSVAGTWCLGVGIACATMPVEDAAAAVLFWCLLILVFFALALVEHSCRFWVESRQNGNLESLLVVPLQPRQILSSHWASIRRHFLWPLVVVLGVATLPTWILLGSAFLKKESATRQLPDFLFLYIYLGAAMCWFFATCIAIGYTGMWLALRLRRPQFASGVTLLCTVILPFTFCPLGLGMTLVFIFLPMSLLQSNLRRMLLQRYIPVVKHAGADRM